MNIIDRLACWWINYRQDQELKNNSELSDLGIKRVDIEDGVFKVLLSHPSLYLLANEFASMLKEFGVENYISFDMMPRMDKGDRPVRVTLQYADGLSPAQKATKLEERLERYSTRFKMVGEKDTE